MDDRVWVDEWHSGILLLIIPCTQNIEVGVIFVDLDMSAEFASVEDTLEDSAGELA